MSLVCDNLNYEQAKEFKDYAMSIGIYPTTLGAQCRRGLIKNKRIMQLYKISRRNKQK